MRRNIRKNNLLRCVAAPLFVSGLALGVPAGIALGSSAPAGAAVTTTAPASNDPVGDLVANIEANVEYYVCVTELTLLNDIEYTPGFCVQPPPLSS